MTTKEIKKVIAEYNAGVDEDMRLEFGWMQYPDIAMLKKAHPSFHKQGKATLRVVCQERKVGLPQCDVCAGKASVSYSLNIGDYNHFDGVLYKETKVAFGDHKPNCSEAKKLMRLAENIGVVKQ